jgi:two-component system, chemotaxis family, chemotaxis protein CheY
MLKKILVVDDNAVIRRLLYTLFKSEVDFDVCGEAANGKEAIERAQELHPDVIVLDLSMPVMNGLDAARILNGLMPMVPLIMFSEYGEAFTESAARSAGISAMVSKFARVSVLVEKVRLLCRVNAA